MNTKFLSIIFSGICLFLCSSTPIEQAEWPKDLDFEGAKLGNGHLAQQWFAPGKEATPHYQVEVVSSGAYSGKDCATIRSTGRPYGTEFGNIMQYIDATPFRGKTIRFTAAVRVEPPSTSAPMEIDNRGYLGVQYQPVGRTEAEVLGLGVPRGVQVTTVTKASAAEAAGLQLNDVILAIDGLETSTADQFVNKIMAHKAGDKITVHIWRSGKESDISATLHPREEYGNNAPTNKSTEGHLWMRVDRDKPNTGFFDNMDDRPVISNEWKTYEIKGRVHDDAKQIYIGCFLIGQGTLYFDNVKFEILTGKDTLPLMSRSRFKGPANLNFEEPTLSISSGGWYTPLKKYTPNYEVQLVPNGAYLGKQYVAVYSTGKPTGREFGNVMQCIDAAPYRGKTIRFRGAVKLGSDMQTGRGQLWLRVDRPNSKMGFFDNMDDRPITSTEWKEYDIIGTVDSDAVDICFGCMLIGEGKVNFDAASIEITDEHPISSSLSSARNGWIRAGSKPGNYQMGTKNDAENTNFITFTSSEEPSGFGTYMKMHDPGAWAGKKLKMTAFVRTENVENWCGMWCRVDGSSETQQTLDFDNMSDRPIKGTTDWKKYEIIVNVPKEASAIAYGVLVDGKGAAYFKNVNFEVIGESSK